MHSCSEFDMIFNSNPSTLIYFVKDQSVKRVSHLIIFDQLLKYTFDLDDFLTDFLLGQFSKGLSKISCISNELPP